MVNQNAYYKSLESCVKDIPNWNFLSITELANSYCDYFDKGDRFTSDKYHCAIICRYWYMVSYIYERRTGNMLLWTYEDCQDIVIDGINRALTYRGWRDESQPVSKEINGAKKVIDRCIYTEEMRAIKKLNTKKRQDELGTLSLEYTYDIEEGTTTLVNAIVDPSSMLENDDYLLCKDVVNYYIRKGNYKNAIIVDSICFKKPPVKLLNKIDASYVDYFCKKYSVDKDKVTCACNKLVTLSDGGIKRIVSATLKDLRSKKEALGIC